MLPGTNVGNDGGAPLPGRGRSASQAALGPLGSRIC
jgi:hypothetical protein